MREAVRTLTDIGEDAVCETVLHEGDQPSATVRVDLDDEHLELTVDEDCTVVGFERDR